MAGVPLPLTVSLLSFSNAYQAACGRQTQGHIAASRVLLAQAGAQGFPTLLLEDGRGHMRVLELSHYLGHPQQWLSYLRKEYSEALGLFQAIRTLQTSAEIARVIQSK